MAAPITVNNWTFQGATNYALTGSAVTFSGASTPGIVSTTNGSISVANVISGATASIGHVGDGTLALTGVGSTIGGSLQLASQTVGGKIEIKTGSLTVGGQTLALGGTLAVSNGGTLTSQGPAAVSQFGTAQVPQAVVTGAGSAWNIQNDLVIGGAFGGAGGAGTVTIADGGTVTVSPAFSTSIAAGSTLNLGTGALAGSIVTSTINNDGQIVANFTDTSTIDATIAGAGSLTKSGTGKLILTGATNSDSGDTIVTGGTLTTTNGGALGNSIAKFSSGTTLQLDGSFGFTNAVTVAGNVNIDVTFNTTLSTANTAFILGDITDGASSGGITKTGVGTLVLSGNNSYSGATTVSAGTLRVDSNSALPLATDMKVNTGATLEIGDTVLADVNSLANGTAGGGTVKIGTNDFTTTLFVGHNGGAATTFGGSIIGPGNFEIDGGSLKLTGVSSVGGDLVVCDCAALTISGPGASFTASGSGQIASLPGTDVAGALNVLNGAVFNTNNLLVGGSMLVDGANTIVTASGLTFIGSASTAANLAINNGAVVNSQAGAVIENPLENASVTVTGQNSVWNVGTSLTVGNGFASAPGSLTIMAGGVVNSTGGTSIGADLSLGRGPSAVTVTGAGAVLNADNLLAIGYSCVCGDFAGTLTVADGGRLNATGTTQIGTLGVLNIGTGGLAGTIVAPTITNNGQIVANFTDTATLAANIDGTGSLAKSGTGKLILSGSSTYTGATTINGGTLTVNGSIANSFVTLEGGTLGGNGTVGGFSALSGATIAPGNSIGTLTVAGPVTFNAGSIYQVEVNAAGQADKIVATGAATINGGTVQVLAPVGNYGLTTNYNILHASSVSGTFASVTSSLVFLTASLAYTPTDVTLTLTRNASAFASVAQTFNQRAVGGALDASPFGSPLVQSVLPLTVPQALGAFDQLSGETHASAQGVLVDESLYVRSAILGRLRQASYSGDARMTSLSLGGPQSAFVNNGELDSAPAYAKLPIVTKAPLLAPAASRDVVFWSQGFGAWGKFNSDSNAVALKRDLAGFITGFDARFGDWRGGVAAGYTASRNNTEGRGSANVETGHMAAYGGWNAGALKLRGGAAYALHTIDTDRTIVFPGFFDRATAHYQGGTGQIFGEAGYGFVFGKVALEPFAGAAWVRLDTDAFSEKGGIAALNGTANSFEAGYATLGIRAASMIPLGQMILVPRASAAWQHRFNSVTPAATVAFQSTGATFLVAGVPIARDSLLAEAGLDLAVTGNATVGVSYTGQLASNVADHAAKGKFALKF